MKPPKAVSSRWMSPTAREPRGNGQWCDETRGSRTADLLRRCAGKAVMDAGSFALVLTCVFLWAVLSAKAERAYLSAPIVFVAVGWLLAAGLDLLHPGHEAVKVVAETTLVCVLFADASTVRIR